MCDPSNHGFGPDKPSHLATPFGPETNMTLPNSSTYQGQVVYEDLYRGEEYDYQLDDQGQVVYEDL